MSELTKFNKGGSLFKGGIFATSAEDAAQSMVTEVDFGGSGDASWMAHRQTSMTSGRIDWAFPLTSEKKSQGMRPVTEITKKTNFVAFRGVFLGFYQGFRFAYMDGNKYVPVCQTTRLERDLGNGEVEVYENRNPLEIAVSRQYKSKKDPCAVSYELSELEKMGYTLYGSRPEVGKTTGLRSCSSCVMAGEHMKVLGNTNEPYCKPDGYALFCVFELAIEDPEYDEVSGDQVSLIWKPVDELGLVTIDGDKRDKLDRPFILKVTSLGKSQFQKIGTGEFDRNVITSGSTCYLPEGVGSFGQFYETIKKDQLYVPLTKEAYEQTGHAVAYPFVVEGYVGELVKEQYTQSHIPVFRIDKEVGEDISSYIETALSLELHELSLVMDPSDRASKKVVSAETANSDRAMRKHKDVVDTSNNVAIPTPAVAEPMKSAAPVEAASSINLMDITASAVEEEEEEEEKQVKSDSPPKSKFAAFRTSKS